MSGLEYPEIHLTGGHHPTHSLTGKIFTAMPAVMRAIGAVGKDKTNQDQGFKYRSIDGVYNEVHSALAAAGVFMTPNVLERTRSDWLTGGGKKWQHVTLKVMYTFFAEDGSHVDAGPIYSEGIDSGDKASMKALAHAHKYALLQVFCIPTEDLQDDIDQHSHEPAPQAPRTAPVKPQPVKPAPVAAAPAVKPAPIAPKAVTTPPKVYACPPKLADYVIDVGQFTGRHLNTVDPHSIFNNLQKMAKVKVIDEKWKPILAVFKEYCACNGLSLEMPPTETTTTTTKQEKSNDNQRIQNKV